MLYRAPIGLEVVMARKLRSFVAAIPLVLIVLGSPAVAEECPIVRAYYLGSIIPCTLAVGDYITIGSGTEAENEQTCSGETFLTDYNAVKTRLRGFVDLRIFDSREHPLWQLSGKYDL